MASLSLKSRKRVKRPLRPDTFKRVASSISHLISLFQHFLLIFGNSNHSNITSLPGERCYQILQHPKNYNPKKASKMMVLSMNTKRQRRPNVRLGDIGDVSASFSGKSILKSKLDKPIWEIKTKTKNNKDWSNSESPRASIYNHNWENWNPNSKEYDLGLEETDRRNLRMGFGMVNRKRRLKKQRMWSMNGGALNSAWNSRVSPGVGNKNEKAYGYGNSNGYSVNTDYGHLDHDSWDKDEDACEGNSSDSLPVSSWKQENDLPSDGVHCLSDKIGSAKKPKEVSTIVNSVKEWLMDLGFGKYAGLFEMHEVDGEALPLLTYEDLKEMGIAAVGTRRRIYSAIRLLSKESDNTR